MWGNCILMTSLWDHHDISRHNDWGSTYQHTYEWLSTMSNRQGCVRRNRKRWGREEEHEVENKGIQAEITGMWNNRKHGWQGHKNQTWTQERYFRGKDLDFLYCQCTKKHCTKGKEARTGWDKIDRLLEFAVISCSCLCSSYVMHINNTTKKETRRKEKMHSMVRLEMRNWKESELQFLRCPLGAERTDMTLTFLLPSWAEFLLQKMWTFDQDPLFNFCNITQITDTTGSGFWK